MAERTEMSSSSFSQRSETESLSNVEESLLADGKSSPVVWGRQESVFLAESSTLTSVEGQESSGCEQKQNFKEFNVRSISGSCETIQSESVAESEIITEEGDYSVEFESAGSSEGELSTKDDSGAQATEIQGTYIRKKLAVLTSKLGSKTESLKEQVKDKKIVVGDEMNTFCSRKMQVIKVKKLMTDGPQCKWTVLTAKQAADKPVVGNKRKIEGLKVENLMSKTEKLVKQKNFHDPQHCTDCRNMRSNIARTEFLKRKIKVVKRPEFEERLQEHLYQKDSSTLIADIVNSCTKATAPPSEVWEKFLLKGDNKNNNGAVL